MRSHAGPEHEADPGLIMRDMKSRIGFEVGTLRPQLAQPVARVPDSLLPYEDKPSFYQVNIFTSIAVQVS